MQKRRKRHLPPLALLTETRNALPGLTPSPTAEMPMTNAFNDILNALKRYYDGLYRGDIALLESVFHPQAIYHTASGGAPLTYNMPAYMDVVRNRQSPAQRGDAYRFNVESIRFAGGDTALAVLTCAMMGKRFTDFLSFTRIDGEWRIAAKVFHYDLISEG